MLVAERKERTQTKRGLGVSIEQRVANHQLWTLVNPQQLLLQYHSTHTIGNRRAGGVLEVCDVLVTARLVDSVKTVQCEVERLVVLNDGLVER